MNDSFLLELPSVLQKDSTFLSLLLANNILRDQGGAYVGRMEAAQDEESLRTGAPKLCEFTQNG